MLQEKLLGVNEKLCNVFEEMQLVQKFHAKVDDFLSELRDKMCDKPIEHVIIDSSYQFQVEKFTVKALNSLKQFKVFFD